MGKDFKDKTIEFGEFIIKKIYSDLDPQSPDDISYLIHTLLVLTYQRFYIPIKDNNILGSDKEIEDFFLEEMIKPALKSVHLGYKKGMLN